MPYSKRAWLDYLDLESKVSGLCLMNISINHPGCPWNNYLAQPAVAGTCLAQDTAGFIRSPSVILAVIIICLQLRSWLVLCNRWLFIPSRALQHTSTSHSCSVATHGCSPRPLRHTNKPCQRQQLPPFSVKCKPEGAHSGPFSVSAALTWTLSCSHVHVRTPTALRGNGDKLG